MPSVFILVRDHSLISHEFSIVGVSLDYTEILSQLQKKPKITQRGYQIREYELGKPYREDGVIDYIVR